MRQNEDCKLVSLLRNQIEPVASTILSYLNLTSSRSREADSCSSEIGRWASSALAGHHWALKAFDSWGRLESGLYGGSLLNSLGNYEQCIETGDTDETELRATYCLAHIDLSTKANELAQFTHTSESVYSYVPSRLAQVAICVPSICSNGDIKEAINGMLEFGYLDNEIDLKQVECVRLKSTGYDNKRTIAIIVTLLMIVLSTFLMILSSVKLYRRNNVFSKLTDISSFVQNYKKIFDRRYIKLRSNERSISFPSLDGIRAISTLWIIIFHSYNFGDDWLSYNNQVVADDKYKSIKLQMIANGYLVVNNHILIAGFLAYFSTNNNIEVKKTTRTSSQSNKPKLNQIFDLVLSRYLRLMPSMMLLIIISLMILPELGDGPNWSRAIRMFTNWCEPNWIYNLFLVHNFVSPPTICFGHTWFLAVDLQLFILILVIIAFSLKANISFEYLVIGFILIVQTSIAYLVYERNIKSIPKVAQDSLESYLDYHILLYIKPYQWFTSYSIGCLISKQFLASRIIKKQPTRRLLLVQLTSLIILIGLMFSSLPYFRRTMSMVESTLIAALVAPLWSIGLGSLLYTLVISKKKYKTHFIDSIIRNFLGSNFWIPFSNLSLSANLLNPILIALFYGTRTETFRFNHYLMLYFAIGNIALTFFAALIFNIIYEQPIRALVKRYVFLTRIKLTN